MKRFTLIFMATLAVATTNAVKPSYEQLENELKFFKEEYYKLHATENELKQELQTTKSNENFLFNKLDNLVYFDPLLC